MRLSLAKVITGRTPGTSLTPGTNVTYALTVANAGPSDARGAVIVDTMPDAIIPSVATGSGWVC